MQNILIFTPFRAPAITQPITATLQRAGYRVACPNWEQEECKDTNTLCAAFDGQPPDLVLADLSSAQDSLPLRYLRRLLTDLWGADAPTNIPVMALFQTWHVAQPDWPAYTDDFLLPPYTPEEALARVRLLLFRRRHIRDDNTLRYADIVLDLASERARSTQDGVLPLRPREFELLRFLITHRGKYFSRTRLLDLVWGIEFEGSERTVDIHINRLRAKLPPQAAELLETRRGLGYGFRIPA